MDCVQRALTDAKLTPPAIDKIVLVGGSTRTPLVSAMLEERLGQAPHQEVNPDLCVAMGAAVQAAIIGGADVGAVLVDVTPHSLGIKCLDDSMGFPFEFRFAPIIRRNTPLPASRSEVFHTYRDRQKEVEIDVYQGESDDVRRNARVGKFMIQGSGAGRGRQSHRGATRSESGRHVESVGAGAGDGLAEAGGDRKRPGPVRARGARRGPRTARPLVGRSGGRRSSDEDEEDEEGDDEGAEDEVPSLAPGPREGQREAVQARALLEKAERLMERVQAGGQAGGGTADGERCAPP